MAILFVYFTLTIMSVFVAYLLKSKFEMAVPVTFFGIIALLYFFAIFGALELGVYVCIAIAFAGFVLVLLRAKRNFWLEKIITSGFVVFVLILIVTWWGHRSRMLINWDEFSHWGYSVKAMYMWDSLPRGSYASIMFSTYPPATTLFHYFFAKLYGSFTEGNLFRSMNILCISMVLPVFARFSFKHIWNNIIAFILVIVSPLVFSEYYYTDIYVDSFLGVLFAFTIFTYYSKDQTYLTRFSSLFLSLFVLSITKSSGFGLALLACFICSFDYLYHQLKIRHLQIKAFSQPLCYFASAVVGYLSWKIYLLVTNTGSTRKTSSFTLDNFAKLLSGNEEDYKYDVITNFFKALSTTKHSALPFSFTIITWGLVIFVFMYLLYKQAKDKSLTRNIFAGTFCGGILFITSLLLAYIYSFAPFEAIKLASFSRYLSTYFTGIIFLLVYVFIDLMPLIEGVNPLQAFAQIITCAIIISVANTTNLANITFDAPLSVRYSESLREDDITLVAQTKFLDPSKDNIYFIDQNTTEFGLYKAFYAIYPVSITGGSIGSLYNENDIWTYAYTCNQWLDILNQGFTYVYINYCDEQFIKEFGDAFESKLDIHNRTLFKVNINQGKVRLSKVNSANSQ